MKTVINFITQEAFDKNDLSYRNAMGYPWSKLVKIEGSVWGKTDFDNSIPGQDVRWDDDALADQINKLKIIHGADLVVVDYKFGDKIDGEIVASLTGLWCGGLEMVAYLPSKKEELAETEATEETVINPAYSNMTFEQIKTAETAWDNLQNEGTTEGFNPYRDNLFISK
ncbi:MAG: hypothetical protein RLZ75_2181 [Pseudomonadota bacterium]|jgi:hypothetical protein